MRDSILQKLQDKRKQNIWRDIDIIEYRYQKILKISGDTVLDFSSNDYLGLAQHPDIKIAAQKGIQTWGVGSTSAHLVTGHTSAHRDLEQLFADFVGAEKALLFSTGYMANMAVMSSLAADKSDTIIMDKLSHASLIDGGILSRGKLLRYPHLDVKQAYKFLSQHKSRSILTTDAVFSMDGDIAPLDKLLELTQSTNNILYVDDAHGLGVLSQGKGSLHQFAIFPKQDCILMATLGKALGGFGALVAADACYIDYLIQYARPFTYTTALPPALACASIKSLEILQTDEGKSINQKLRSNIIYFKKIASEHQLKLLPSETAIQPMIIGDALKTSEISLSLLKKGFKVGSIRPPTVPWGTARLRITLSSTHTEQDIYALVDCISHL